MISKKHFLSICFSFICALNLNSAYADSQAQNAQNLQIKVYQADTQSFNVTSTLVTGATEAVLIDTGFTRADAYRIAANILDSGKKLTTILISQADPDYYFGSEVLTQIFPNAKLVTTQAVLNKIRSKLDSKLAFWTPKMGANAPHKPRLPSVLEGQKINIDQQSIEIRGTTGLLAHRPYVWIPSIRTITGNVSVNGGMHVWLADTKTIADRQAWFLQLEEMMALQPSKVIPGHSKVDAAFDSSAIQFTKDYLLQFENAVEKSNNSAELIEMMKKNYPNLDSESLSLDLSAKVIKGEMKW